MSKKENRREDHKRARAAEKQALRGDHLREVRAYNWGSKEIQPPIVNDVMPHRSKKKGCKRNKGGKHEIVSWPLRQRALVAMWDEETQRIVHHPLPWWQRRYHPEYRCRKCNKGFWRVPKGHAVVSRVLNTTSNSVGNPSQEDLADHWSVYNIKLRLLDLPCRCPECS